MKLRAKLLLGFLSIAILGTIQGIIALVNIEDIKSFSETSLTNSQQGQSLSIANTETSKLYQELAAFSRNLNEHEEFYATLNEHMMMSILGNKIQLDETAGTPLLSWVDSIQNVFVDNPATLDIKPNAMEQFLFGPSRPALEDALKAYQKKQEEADEIPDDNLFLMLNASDDTATPEAAPQEDTKAPIALKDYILAEDLMVRLQSLHTHENAFAEKAYPAELNLVNSQQRIVAEKLAALREPYLDMLIHARRVGELWTQAHQDEFGATLMDQLRTLKDGQDNWARNIFDHVYLGETLTITLNPDETHLGQWLPSNFCRDFRKSWKLFDTHVSKIETERLALHKALNELLPIQDKAQRINLYEKKAKPHVAAIDASFKVIFAAEGLLISKQGRAQSTINRRFLPAWASFKKSLADASQTIKSAVKVAQAAKETCQTALLTKEAQRNQQEQARLNRENKQIAGIKSNIDQQSNTISLVRSLIGLVFVTAIIVGIAMSTAITSRIHKTISAIKTVADGDLTRNIKAHSRDEIGDLAESVNHFIVNLRDIMRHIQGAVSQIAQSSKTLSTISSEIETRSEAMRQQTAEAASATSQISQSMSTVNQSTQVMHNNIQSLATTMTSLSGSMETIQNQMALGKQDSALGSDQAQDTTALVVEMRDTSTTINEVTDLIKDISEQSKLLALNARIESARAGAAGKSFGVVANEIQMLSQETNEAVITIEDRIQNMQNKADQATSSVESINNVIHSINQGMDNMTGLVGSQATETTKSTSQITEVNEQISIISKHIEETSTGLGDISTIVNQTASGVEKSTSEAKSLQRAAKDLNAMADDLEQRLAQFTL